MDISQLGERTLEHVQNSLQWKLPFLPPIPIHPWLTLHGLMILIGAASLLLIFCVVYKKEEQVPTGATNLLEALVVFIRDEVAVATLGPDMGRKMTPLLCNYFFFILTLNLLGMLPIFASATANINVTGALAFITFTFMVIGSIYRNGFLGFLKTFVPSGIPWPFLFLVVPIEFVGLFVKAIALTVRLFANMLAGHLVILTLVGLVTLLGLVALPAVVLAVFVSLLELLVAFLQAYIFTLLSALFIGQMWYPEH